jgi:hypothetical protein
MSTRGLIGFRLDGEDFLQYNHSDSYPTYLGESILFLVKDTPLTTMKDFVRQVTRVNDDDKPTKKQLAKLLAADPDVADDVEPPSKGSADLTWYEVMHRYRGNLNAQIALKLPFWVDYEGFQYCASCEWMYLINLDTEEVEIYTAHWAKKEDASRYYPVIPHKGRYACPEDDRSVCLIEVIPFAELAIAKKAAITQLCVRLNDRH